MQLKLPQKSYQNLKNRQTNYFALETFSWKSLAETPFSTETPYYWKYLQLGKIKIVPENTGTVPSTHLLYTHLPYIISFHKFQNSDVYCRLIYQHFALFVILITWSKAKLGSNSTFSILFMVHSM